MSSASDRYSAVWYSVSVSVVIATQSWAPLASRDSENSRIRMNTCGSGRRENNVQCPAMTHTQATWHYGVRMMSLDLPYLLSFMRSLDSLRHPCLFGSVHSFHKIHDFMCEIRNADKTPQILSKTNHVTKAHVACRHCSNTVEKPPPDVPSLPKSLVVFLVFFLEKKKNPSAVHCNPCSRPSWLPVSYSKRAFGETVHGLIH